MKKKPNPISMRTWITRFNSESQTKNEGSKKLVIAKKQNFYFLPADNPQENVIQFKWLADFFITLNLCYTYPENVWSVLSRDTDMNEHKIFTINTRHGNT